MAAAPASFEVRTRRGHARTALAQDVDHIGEIVTRLATPHAKLDLFIGQRAIDEDHFSTAGDTTPFLIESDNRSAGGFSARRGRSAHGASRHR